MELLLIKEVDRDLSSGISRLAKDETTLELAEKI